MRSALFLVVLLSSASTSAETLAVQQGEYPYKDLVQTAQFKGGYNMGPNSKHGIMKGMARPMQGSGGFKWGPCNRSMLSDSFVNGWIRTPGGRYRNPAYLVKPGGVACAKL